MRAGLDLFMLFLGLEAADVVSVFSNQVRMNFWNHKLLFKAALINMENDSYTVKVAFSLFLYSVMLQKEPLFLFYTSGHLVLLFLQQPEGTYLLQHTFPFLE